MPIHLLKAQEMFFKEYYINQSDSRKRKKITMLLRSGSNYKLNSGQIEVNEKFEMGKCFSDNRF